MWLRLFIVSLFALSVCLGQQNIVGNDDSFDEYFPQLDWSDPFDWQLLKTVSKHYDGNVLISPLSLKLALIILYEGSAGSTERQFQSVLNINSKNETRALYKKFLESVQSNHKDLTTNIGTRLFLDSSIRANQQFSSIIKTAYQAEVESTNFSQPNEASQNINSWVNSVTNGHIKELTKPDDITDDVLLYVANAIFFKGSWRTQFPKNNSHTGGFYLTPTNLITVPYIANTEKYYYSDSVTFDAKIIRLPYQGQHFSLFIILPNSKGGLPELLQKINLSTLKQHLYLMDKKTVSVVIPKFKFEFSSSYSNILQEFGLDSMFSNTASFPGIARGLGTGSKFLFVNDIKQKTGIEVNEEGSVAFASTEIQLGNKFGEPEFTFNASHPFLFFLEDQLTGTILFSGKIVNPLDTISVPSRFNEDEPSPITVSNNLAQQSEIQPTVTPVLATQSANGQSQFQQGVNNQNFNNQYGNVQPQNGQNQNANFNPVVQEDTAILSRFNYFDLEILAKIFDDRENYFISPASIKIALSMLMEGSRGKCAQEISDTIRIPVNVNSSRGTLSALLNSLSTKSGNTILNVANLVGVSNKYSLVPGYGAILNTHYHAQIARIDFTNSVSAAAFFNDWVNRSTQGLIREIIRPESFDDASVVIANALYFKAQWKTEFDYSRTKMDYFTSSSTEKYLVETMKVNSQFRYRFVDELNAKAVELPYSDGEYAMLILLPNEKTSVDSLQKDLQHTSFSTIVNSLEVTEMLVSLPKFDIEYNSDLGPVLETMGIKEIFSENANLSGIVQDREVKISKILHKAKVEVNEKGTTAAAATGAVVIPLMGSSSESVIANRPFLFFIYNINSKNVLFEGRLNRPPKIYNQISTEYPQPVANPSPIRNTINTAHRNPVNSQIPVHQEIHFNTETSGRSSSGDTTRQVYVGETHRSTFDRRTT